MILAALAFIFVAEPESAAHALVVSSTPAANTALSESTVDIRMQFNSRIDAKRSKLSIVSANGQVFPVDAVDAGGVDVLAGRVTDLPPGAYRIRWQVLAIDGHITRGDIPFTVVEP